MVQNFHDEIIKLVSMKNILILLKITLLCGNVIAQAPVFPNNVVYNNCEDGCEYFSIDFIQKGTLDTVARFNIQDNNPFGLEKKEIVILPEFPVEIVGENFSSETTLSLLNQGENFGTVIYKLNVYSDAGDLVDNYSNCIVLGNNGQTIWDSGIKKIDMSLPIISNNGNFLGLSFGQGQSEHSLIPVSESQTVIIDILQNDTIFTKTQPEGYPTPRPYFVRNLMVFEFNPNLHTRNLFLFDPDSRTLFNKRIDEKKLGELIRIDTQGITTKSHVFTYQEDFKKKTL